MTTDSDIPGADAPPASEPARPSESAASVSRSTMPRPGLPALVRAGLRAVGRYPGLVASIYLLQVILSAGAALAMMMLLHSVFGDRPIFARAMDGDVGALLACLRSPPGKSAILGLVWLGLGAILLYGALSWFLTAGLIAVFLDAPSTRREVVRWFGAAGASHFLPFFRLALWSALPYAAVLFSASVGLSWADARLDDAATIGQLLEALGLGLCPALVLHWVVAAAVDYARVDLVRHPGMSSLRALARGFGLVLRRQLALVHTALYGAFFAAVTALYLWSANAWLLPGLVGLIALRQVAGLTRFAAHVVLIAGQVELAWASMTSPMGHRR